MFLSELKFSILAPKAAGPRGRCRMGEPRAGSAPLPAGCRALGPAPGRK